MNRSLARYEQTPRAHGLPGEGKIKGRTNNQHLLAVAQAVNEKSISTLHDYREVWEYSNAALVAESTVRDEQRERLARILQHHETVEHSHVLDIDIMCSDGRLDLYRVYGKAALHHEVFAVPGSIILPSELRDRGLHDRDNIENTLDHVHEWREHVFNLFEQRWGKKIEDAVHRGETVNLNLFSHFDTHNPRHSGCGAHHGHTEEAQLETALNEIVLLYWLRHRFPQYMGRKQHIFVNRLAYDTHEGTPRVLGAHSTDITFKCADRVRRVIHGAMSTPNKSLVRPHPQRQNPLEQAEDFHNELGICISNKSQFHSLLGVSTFKLSWQENAKSTFDQVKLLLGLARKFYLAKHPGRPIIIHMDIPDGDSDTATEALSLRKLITHDLELADLKIEFFLTNTHSSTGKSKEIKFSQLTIQ